MNIVQRLLPTKHGTDSARHVAFALVVFFALVVVRTAWIMDDAYISFRCVDNAIHGYGLRWNTFERVEAFTNPLWTLVMCAAAVVTREVYRTGLVLQIALSVTVAWLVVRGSRSTLVACASVAVLTLSRAFVDYSTSGLENPLSHLLVALFAFGYLAPGPFTPRALRRLTFLASLALVNRLDLAVLFAPALGWAYVAGWRGSTDAARKELVRAAAVGLAPLAGWELFSLFYYGAWIPNSALAKLTSHASRIALVRHGVSLFRDTLTVDPLTPLCIALGTIAAFARGPSRARALASGVVATLAYIVWVGGDHMSGRFFTVPFLVAVILAGSVDVASERAVIATSGAAALAAAWMAGLPTLGDQFVSLRPSCVADVEDYRREWYPSTGLLAPGRLEYGPDHDWVRVGQAASRRPEDVPVWGGIGLAGYYAGPHVRAIDEYGLSDALLARLPMPDGPHETYFKAGHHRRTLPDGYLATVRDGQNRIVHPALAAYYDKLALVTQGPLFSPARMLEAIKLSVGAYDGLLATYVAFQDQKSLDASALPPARTSKDDGAMRDCPTWWRTCAPLGVTFSPTGLRVRLGGLEHAKTVAADLSAARWVLVFTARGVEVGRTTVDLVDGKTSIPVDSAAAAQGYDAVSFLPPGVPDGPWSLRSFELE